MTAVHILTNMESAAPRRATRIERRRLRLSTLARRSGLDPRREVLLCQRNGRWVLQKHWSRTLVGKNDVVTFVVMPASGQVARTVASIAVLIVAAIAAPYLVAPLGLTGLAATAATAAVTASIAAVGSYAINALIPLPRQDAPGLSNSLNAQSPTYSFTISSQQNLPRLGGAIPEWFGYHRVIPDLAATSWWEWQDGFQTLYQTMCLTKGSLAIEKIELGRTPISTFEDVTHEIFEPGETADLFEAEVYQSPDVSAITLNAPNDLPAGDDGIYGPFPVVPPGQTTNRFGFDIGFPRGLYESADGTSMDPKTASWRIEAQEIDDAGAAVGAWFDIANVTFDADPSAVNTAGAVAGVIGTFVGGAYDSVDKLNSPLTLSYRYQVLNARRYQARVRRTDNKDLTLTSGHEVAWTGLRGFLGGGSYGTDHTILQIAIKATASINSRNARQVAVTGTRKLPMWDPETQTWSEPQATRSIAWAAAHVLRSQNGGRLDDSLYDLSWLATYDAIWEARGDYFDYYATEQRVLWEMLQTVLRCGRGVPYRQGGKVRFHRDEPQTMPITGFSRENIVQRTLRIDYRTPEPENDFDGFEVRYFDKRVWNFNTLRKAFVGDAAPLRPQSRPLDGCTELAQAQRELDYYVAEYKNRPISISFDTEMEGLYPARGDLVLVDHDSPRWGLSNRVLSWDAGTKTVVLFSPPLWSFAGVDDGWYARFRDVRGRYSAQVLITAAPDDATIILNNAPVYDDGGAFDFTLSDSELLHVMLGKSNDEPRAALFLEMTPRGQGRVVSVRAVLEDAAVHVN